MTNEIDLGGQTVQNGDGILLLGRTLYVVQNSDNQIAVIALGKGLAAGTVARTITSPGFDVPTTIDRLGTRLYAVNARFGTTADADDAVHGGAGPALAGEEAPNPLANGRRLVEPRHVPRAVEDLELGARQEVDEAAPHVDGSDGVLVP